VVEWMMKMAHEVEKRTTAPQQCLRARQQNRIDAVEMERQRSRAGEILHVITEFKIFAEPVYDLIMWFLTLTSVVVAVYESQVC
jgi:hypothetical protein